MKLLKLQQSIPVAIVLAAVVALAGCAPKEAPRAYVPPRPPAIVVPPQPQPPIGAPANLTVPPTDAFGIRRTINAGISPAQTTWNLRSAYNVAALNCLQPQHTQILVNYRAFLRTHAKKLTAVNKIVDQEFKTRYGTRFIPPREAYMTQVYNYFALPPTLPAFCDAALAISHEAAAVPSADLDAFAARGLPQLELVFLQFYRSYEQYRTDLVAWQGKYMAPSLPVLPASIQLPMNSSQSPAR